jgi:hypothetical protein
MKAFQILRLKRNNLYLLILIILGSILYYLLTCNQNYTEFLYSNSNSKLVLFLNYSYEYSTTKIIPKSYMSNPISNKTAIDVYNTTKNSTCPMIPPNLGKSNA